MKTNLTIVILLLWARLGLAGRLDPFIPLQKPSVYLTKLASTSPTVLPAKPVQITIVNHNPKVTTILRLINLPVLVGALLVPKDNSSLRNGLLLTGIGLSGAALYFQFHKRKASLSSGIMSYEKGYDSALPLSLRSRD